jgi:hypothetical protein
MRGAFISGHGTGAWADLDSTMTTLTFRGHHYEARTAVFEKPSVPLTYRRSAYRARQIEAAADVSFCLPEGFIRSVKTAELIGLPLERCSTRHLTYRGVAYVK